MSASSRFMSAIAASHFAFACWYDADADPVQSERSGASSDSSWSSRPWTWAAEARMSAAAATRPPKSTLSCPAFMAVSPGCRSGASELSAETAGQLGVGRGLLLVGSVVGLLRGLEVRLELVQRGGDLACALVPARHHLLEGRRSRALPLGADPGELAPQAAQLLVEVASRRLHHLRGAREGLVLLAHLAGHRQPPFDSPVDGPVKAPLENYLRTGPGGPSG